MYSLLDFVGDVGGLLDGLKLIAWVIVIPFSSYNYITLLLTKLISVQDEEAVQEQDSLH